MGNKSIVIVLKSSILFLLFSTLSHIVQAQSIWTQKSDLPANGRANASSFSINGKAYVVGGSPSNGSCFNDLWEYDPASDLWTQKANFPGQARAYATSFSIATKGYFGIGAYYNGGNWVQLSDFWEYDSDNDSWSQKVDFPPGPRWFAASFSINGKGYIGTGANSSSGTHTDFWEFDPSTDTWTQKADFPQYRFGCIGFSINGTGYIGLGSYCGVEYKELYQYLPGSNSWVQKTSFPGIGRWKSTCFTLANKAYVGIGVDSNTVMLQDFYEYNSSSDSWIQVANFGGGLRKDAVGFSVLNKGYVTTGYSLGYNNDIWEFSPDTTILSTATDDKNNNITLYPVPMHSKLNITSDEFIDMIKVIKVTGEQVFQKNINSNIFTLDLSHLPNENYLVHIICRERSIVKLIMKQ